MNLLLRSLACALLLAPSLLPAAETQRFVLERPYQVAEIPEPDRNLPATNVILMIGDGMGIHHLSAAWAANRGRLFIENCPVTGISKTWCADKLVTDSAAGSRDGARRRANAKRRSGEVMQSLSRLRRNK